MINPKLIASNKFLLSILILLIGCVVIFQNLPNDISMYMLDSFFGFNSTDVQNTFDKIGEDGRRNYIYSALTLDTIFPLLYALFFISILLKLGETRRLILFVPILTGIIDLIENIQIAWMMSAVTFDDISITQIVYAGIANQCKWILFLLSIGLIALKFITKKLQF